MAVQNKCSECKNPLPPNWRPVATRTVQVVCPECAVRHMKTKSGRRAALAAVGAGSEGSEQHEPAVQQGQ
jgi:Zn finger protein HypA/HybF involved in hydrogenase expression